MKQVKFKTANKPCRECGERVVVHGYKRGNFRVCQNPKCQFEERDR